MPKNTESLSLREKIKNIFRWGIYEVKKLANSNLGENLDARAISVRLSKQQEELLKSHGTICDAIGSKLVVVRNDNWCALFKLTKDNWIEEINLGNADFKVKNISRVFRDLFIIEGENKVKVVKFNSHSDEKWEDEWTFKGYQKWFKDPIDRSISWVNFYDESGLSTIFYANDHGWEIPNFKLVSSK